MDAMVLRCPDCRFPLRHVVGGSVPGYLCPTCNGLGTTTSALRKRVAGGLLDHLWQTAHRQAVASERHCPSCKKAMQLVQQDDSPTLDLCPVCYFIWLDAGELDALPKKAPPVERHPLSPEARAEFRELQAELQRAVAREGGQVESDGRKLRMVVSGIAEVFRGFLSW